MLETNYAQKLKLVRNRLNSLGIDPSEEQLDFILHPIREPSYLKACPGSGKTEVVGIKAAFEIYDWTERFSGIAILSFTKNAAKEITERVKKYSGIASNQHPHYIGTIDSWLHNYILHPFAHKSGKFSGRNNDKSYLLVDNERRYDFLNPFKTIMSYQPKYQDIWVNEYYFECAENPSLQSNKKNLDFTNLSSEVLKNLKDNKKRFLSSGLTTYPDAEFLCFYFLKHNKEILQNIVKRFPIIIIDECQDLSHNQIEILNLLYKCGTVIHFVGDNNQSIYEFKKSYVEEINSFIKTNNLKELLLTKNYRSNQKIVNVSLALEQLNSGEKPNHVIGNEKEIFAQSCILWKYTDDNFPLLPQRFIDHIKTVNSTVPETEEQIKIGGSAVLARAHKTLMEFHNHPNSELSGIELIANAIKCWSNTPRTGEDIKNALQQLGKSLSQIGYNGIGNHQNQFCPDSYSKIEWRNELCRLLIDANSYSNKIHPFEDLTWSQWASNLKVFLESKWGQLKSPYNDWDRVKLKIRAGKGKADELVINTINSINTKYSDKIRITTFHDVKGETLDAVLLVSAKDKHSKGGHYEHWISQKEDEKEYVRFAYVASSRPKHLLIWAIPEKSFVNQTNNIEKIEKLGFELI